MKRIVFFTPSLNIGGVERVFITYSEKLIQLGYDVTYLVCKKEEALTLLLPAKLKVVSLGEKPLRKSIAPLYRFFRNNPVDVFITGGDVPNVLTILVSKLAFSRAKIIISHHNYFNIERSTFWSKFFIRLFYNWATYVVSVSDGITKMLLKQGVSRKKLATIYNPVDLNALLTLGESPLNRDLKTPYILFLGRLGEVKNLLFLLDVFKRVLLDLPTFQLVFVGDGPMKKPLIEKTKALGMDAQVHFMGVLPNPFPILKECAAVILPSFSEALPTIILESFVFKKTVVATPTIGAVDLLQDGELGYLSHSFDDVDEFAELLKKGLSNPIADDLLIKKVNSFCVDAKVKELEKLF